jgi:hypothetical protein
VLATLQCPSPSLPEHRLSQQTLFLFPFRRRVPVLRPGAGARGKLICVDRPSTRQQSPKRENSPSPVAGVGLVLRRHTSNQTYAHKETERMGPMGLVECAHFLPLMASSSTSKISTACGLVSACGGLGAAKGPSPSKPIGFFTRLARLTSHARWEGSRRLHHARRSLRERKRALSFNPKVAFFQSMEPARSTNHSCARNNGFSFFFAGIRTPAGLDGEDTLLADGHVYEAVVPALDHLRACVSQAANP